jgi:hypothetical protein
MKCLLFCICAAAGPALADPPGITDVTARAAGDAWRVSVTIAHPDTGWDHYADGWRIETAEGTVLGTRVLAHPHVTEQPFTRSLSGVDIPSGIQTVYIRARCSVDGWNAGRVALDLP